MKELHSLLFELGNLWRAEHTEIRNESQKNERTVVLLPTQLDIYQIFKEYCHFTFIGVGTNTDKSPLYFYDLDSGLYTDSVDFFNRLLVSFDTRLKPKQWPEIRAFFRTKAYMRKPFDNDNLIPVNNGIFNLKTKRLLPFLPKYTITSKIKTDYIDNAEYPLIPFDFDKWLDSIACDDKDIVTLLWQVMNEAINPNRTRGKMVILTGSGNNGKGTFQALLENLIGRENISNLKPPQFEGFLLSALDGKVCNIGDDISDKYLEDISDLMSVVTGDPIQVNQKYAQPYEATYRLLCLFSGNGLPKSRNKTQGWYRRLCIVPFNADFNGEKERPEIKNKFLRDKDLLEWVLYQILNMKPFDKFIEPKAVEDMTKEYKRDNDFYLSFTVDFYIPNDYHKLKFFPSPVLKDNLETFTRNEGIPNANLYGFAQKFVKVLAEQTGLDYEVKAGRVDLETAKLLDPLNWYDKQFKKSVKGIYRNSDIEP